MNVTVAVGVFVRLRKEDKMKVYIVFRDDGDYDTIPQIEKVFGNEKAALEWGRKQVNSWQLEIETWEVDE